MGLDQCLNTLQSGDTLLVWRLDRLGRSMTHLVQLIEDLGKKVFASNPSVMVPSIPWNGKP